MASILGIPFINLWKWSNGTEYTMEDDNVVLTQELEESDKKIDEDYDKHFKSATSKGNGGKGKGKSNIKNIKIETPTNTKETKTQAKESQKKEEAERDER